MDKCKEGYGGKNCEIKLCPDNCNDNGICEEGKCYCNNGFTGDSCEKHLCMNECSGNGICNTQTGQCECNPGFSGEDCGSMLDNGNTLSDICDK